MINLKASRLTTRARIVPRFGAWRRAALAIGLGAMLGVFLLHPATMAVYWVEFHRNLGESWSTLGRFVTNRMMASFTVPMMPMTLLFAMLGALLGGIFATVDARLRRSERAISYLEKEVAREIPVIIQSGEGERVEFKSTARWDLRENKVNKALSNVVARTIAGFANEAGGSLLIGVDDNGGIIGLGPDYQTLRKEDRDGFAQFIMTLVSERLGGHNCHLVHVLFADVNGRDVCRIVVEPADAPVYFQDGKHARLFVRTGNATRELDAREAIHYVLSRWDSGGRRE